MGQSMRDSFRALLECADWNFFGGGQAMRTIWRCVTPWRGTDTQCAGVRVIARENPFQKRRPSRRRRDRACGRKRCDDSTPNDIGAGEKGGNKLRAPMPVRLSRGLVGGSKGGVGTLSCCSSITTLRELELLKAGACRMQCQQLGVVMRVGQVRLKEIEMKTAIAEELGLAMDRVPRSRKVAQWFDQLIECSAFVQQHDRLPVQHISLSERALARFSSNDSDLSDEQRVALRELLSFGRTREWFRRFNEIKEFAEDFGRLPARHGTIKREDVCAPLLIEMLGVGGF